MTTLKTIADIRNFANNHENNSVTVANVAHKDLIRQAYLKINATHIKLSIPESMHKNAYGRYVVTPAAEFEIQR